MPYTKMTRIESLLKRVQHAYTGGEYGAAAAALREIIELKDREGLVPDSIVHSDLASCLLSLGRIDEAWGHWHRAEEIARQQGDVLALAHARAGMGYAHQAAGEFEKAIHAFKRASALAEKEGRMESVFDMQVCIGGVHFISGSPTAACEAYEKAWQLARNVSEGLCNTAEKDKRRELAPFQASGKTCALTAARLVPVLNNLGGILYGLREFKRAMEILDEAERLFPPEYVETPFETSLRNNRGLVLFAQGRMEEAKYDLKKAMAGYERIGDKERVAEQANILCDLCRRQNDLAGAIGFNNIIIQLEKAHGIQVGEAGMFYQNAGNSSPESGLDVEKTRPFSLFSRALTGNECDATVLDLNRDQKSAPVRPFVIFIPVMQGISGPLFPRGAASVASFLKKNGVPAIVVPLSHWIDPSEGVRAVQTRLDDLVQDLLSSFKPCAIGISIPFSYLYPDALQIAAAVRKRAASRPVPIIAGGPHVSYWDVQCFAESPAIDVVVRGEGEWTTLELLRTLERKGELNTVDGITWRDTRGGTHRNQDRPLGNLLALPAIDFHVLPRAFCEQMDIFGLVSRGCRFRCRFCHEFRFWGGRVRYHPVDQIIEEMGTLEREFDNRYIAIDDSMLDMGTPYFFELFERIQKSSLSRPSAFLTRIDTINTDGLRAMKNASVPALKVGVESGSEKVLKEMRKGISPARMVDSLVLVRREGVEAHAFIIVGHPRDNVQEAEKSIAFIDDLFGRDLILSIDPATFNPYPGTPYFSDPQKHGIQILTMDWRLWRRNNRPICQLDGFSANEIYHAYLTMLEVQSRYGQKAGRDFSG